MHTRNIAQHLVTDGDNNRSSPKVNVTSCAGLLQRKMESENGSGAILGSDSNGPGGKGAALLLVIGEPNTEDDKTHILGEITRGMWHQLTNMRALV